MPKGLGHDGGGWRRCCFAFTLLAYDSARRMGDILGHHLTGKIAPIPRQKKCSQEGHC